MKIIAAHLLNDYSGSPKVLMQLLKGWVKHEIQVELHTCDGRDGFLSDIEGVETKNFTYTFKNNILLRLINLFISQTILCFNVLKSVTPKDIVYVNTVLPFGAAIAGKIKGCRIIYHLHETSVKPVIFKKFLFGIAKWTATDVVYVSNYLAETEPFQKQTIHILHNAIENDFLTFAEENKLGKSELHHVLMVCSLKAYKGVYEFIALARLLPEVKFRLVLNATYDEINEFFEAEDLPSNIELFDSQTNLHPYYQWADLILNLSRPTEWIETFGLTILEGMAYGNPAIVPPVGGVTELIQDHVNGYRIDSNQTALLSEKIKLLRLDSDLYKKLRVKALEAISLFREDYFIQQNIQILQNK